MEGSGRRNLDGSITEHSQWEPWWGHLPLGDVGALKSTKMFVIVLQSNALFYN